MAHVAQIDENNKVTNVIVVANEISDPEQFAKDLLGGYWLQTSYNGNIRKNFAGIGFDYDPILDAFICPKCHDEATLNEETCKWICGNEAHNVPVS